MLCMLCVLPLLPLQGGDAMEMDEGPAPAGVPLQQQQQQQQQPEQPMVDEEGFQVVQRKGRGRR